MGPSALSNTAFSSWRMPFPGSAEPCVTPGRVCAKGCRQMWDTQLQVTFLYVIFLIFLFWELIAAAAAAAKTLQSCPTLCDPRDGSPPGSPVPGILQARTLEWAAISFSNSWKWRVKVKLLSRVRLLATPWTPAYQASPSMGFSRQEYRSGLPLPTC